MPLLGLLLKPNAIIFLVSILGLGALYYYWKDEIESAVYAKIELEQKKAQIELLERQQKANDKAMNELKVQQISHQVSQQNLLKHIQEVADEKSCLRVPISANDARLLVELWVNEDRDTE